MIEPTGKLSEKSEEYVSTKVDKGSQQLTKKGPLSFFTGAVSSIGFAWISWLVSNKVIIYFTLHSPGYTSPIAQNISSALKTLIIGMCFLATFTFAFIGVGLTIVFIRSFFSANDLKDD